MNALKSWRQNKIRFLEQRLHRARSIDGDNHSATNRSPKNEDAIRVPSIYLYLKYFHLDRGFEADVD